MELIHEWKYKQKNERPFTCDGYITILEFCSFNGNNNNNGRAAYGNSNGHSKCSAVLYSSEWYVLCTNTPYNKHDEEEEEGVG